MREYYAVLDIGSRMITMALRLFDAQGVEENTVYAAVESHGIVNMTIDNNPQIVTRIKQLCAILKAKTGVEIKEVYVSYVGDTISVVEYKNSVLCTGITANHTSAKAEDIRKLENSYRDYAQNPDMVVIDHLALEYKKDDRVCPYEDLLGTYAKNISCRFLLFLAQRVHYERLEIALKGANLKCAGIYVGLRACGAYLVNKNERAQALVYLDDGHSEIGFYENGILVRYEWKLGGWEGIRQKLLEEDRYLRPIDLDIKYLETLDLTAFKPEWFEKGNNERTKLKRVGSHLNVDYLVNFREVFAGKWNINLPLKHGGGVILTGVISAIKGISDFFNLCLSRKLDAAELYTIKVAEHNQLEKWEACQPQDANKPLNAFATLIGMLQLLKEEKMPKTTITDGSEQEEEAAGTSAEDAVQKEEEQEARGGKLSSAWHGFNDFIKRILGDDLTSYDSDKEDNGR